MSNSSHINRQRLLERFLRYVQVETTANPDSEEYPSSPGQWTLGKILYEELRAMGLEEVEHDAHGLVWATLPSTAGDGASNTLPTILFNAHVDTSPDASGANVRPAVLERYPGGDIPLEKNGKVIDVASCPALNQLIGHTLITTDGTTLLGGDDKAGVAAIMELAEHLLEHPNLPHGPVRILFTCDEEIGRGALHMDLAKAGAAAGYTLDGGGQAEVENENFSADQMTVRAYGNNIHPSIGKGRMVNALRGLSKLIAALPTEALTPESTEGRDGFIHPYSLSGAVDYAEAKFLLRDFVTERLDDQALLLQATADSLVQETPGLRFELVRQRQYRNMADAQRSAPHVVDFSIAAYKNLGLTPHLGAIRGGTDGAVFSEMGLPTPNLSVGQHNIHSVLEFASLDQMVLAIQHAIEVLNIWQQQGRS
ncbi:peptidase T [Aureliella helgolandensis]|nr:peptidase T [Aureliella helgolandensis]